MKGKLSVSAPCSETFHAVQQMVSKISRKLYIYIYIVVYYIYILLYYYYYYYYIYLSAHVQRTKQALGIAPHEALFKKKQTHKKVY